MGTLRATSSVFGQVRFASIFVVCMKIDTFVFFVVRIFFSKYEHSVQVLAPFNIHGVTADSKSFSQ